MNLSKSGVGASVGKTGAQVGVDCKRRKYLSVGFPGTGLSYRTFFGRPVPPTTLKKVIYLLLGAAVIGAAALLLYEIRN